jgi:hypothetical protein
MAAQLRGLISKWRGESLTYRRNKQQPPEAAALQEKQIPMKVLEDVRRSKIQINKYLADTQRTPTTE